MTESISLDHMTVRRLLPHRYPFLLVDRIIDIDADNSAVGIKNVTANEPHFQGHFPGHPVMPGVLIIEAMAQTAGAICIRHVALEERHVVARASEAESGSETSDASSDHDDLVAHVTPLAGAQLATLVTSGDATLW